MGKLFKVIFILMWLAIMSGCASIVSRSNYPVTINSNPSGATVTVRNKKGIEVHKAITPATIMLSADAGFFSPARYSLDFSKDGYFPGTTSLSARIDGWYIGNIVFGGLIGLLIVDPATGAMWRLNDMVIGNLSPVSDYKVPTPIPPKPDPRLPKAPEVSFGSIVEQLKLIKELKDADILSEEEYEERRQGLIRQLDLPPSD